MKKTILFISPCLSFGGAEKILCWIAENLAKSDEFDIHILDMNLVSNHSGFRRTKVPGVVVHRNEKRLFMGLNNIIRIKLILDLAIEIHASLLIPFTRYPCVLTTIAGKICNIPVLISERGDPKQYIKGLRNIIENRILYSADSCVFQTDGAKMCYGKNIQKRSVIIPNPIFLDEDTVPLPQAERKHTIVNVGRLDNHQKRYDVMIESFALFHDKFPEYNLIIYGKGPDEDNIKALISKFKVDNCVSIKGLTSNSLRDINENGIFLITSDFEGIPNSLLEAMAVGVPVVATRCSPGGAEFLITDHENGLLVNCNDPIAISNALIEYANDLQLEIKCGTNARNVLIRFAPQAIAMQWKNHIKTMI